MQVVRLVELVKKFGQLLEAAFAGHLEGVLKVLIATFLHLQRGDGNVTELQVILDRLDQPCLVLGLGQVGIATQRLFLEACQLGLVFHELSLGGVFLGDLPFEGRNLVVATRVGVANHGDSIDESGG